MRRYLKRAVRIVLAGTLVLVAGSTAALYLYGRFVDRSLGEPSHAIEPPAAGGTAIDLLVEPQAAAHPGETGMTLLRENLDAFAFRLQGARDAGRSLDLMYYIWEDDNTGLLLARELVRAADRGVRIRVLLDDINARAKDAGIHALDTHANIEIRIFNPSRNREGILGRAVELLFRGLSLNRRMHNKAWIIDNRAAIVGGRNIGNEYFDAAEQRNFRDADLLLIGPAVAETSRIFDEFWNSRAVLPISALYGGKPRPLAESRSRLESLALTAAAAPFLERVAQSPSLARLLDGREPVIWSRQVKVVSDSPAKAMGAPNAARLLDELTPLLESTHSEALLISPYFVPGDWGAQKLTALAGQNARVAVLTNSLAATDVGLVHAGYLRYREKLTAGGVELYEFMPTRKSPLALIGSREASLHTKAFVVDGRKGFIGSFNLDPRSAELNTEMGVFFADEQLAQQMRAVFEHDTDGTASFRVFLENGSLRWEDGRADPPKIWTVEPESSLWRRLKVKILSWLPIESQL